MSDDSDAPAMVRIRLFSACSEAQILRALVAALALPDGERLSVVELAEGEAMLCIYGDDDDSASSAAAPAAAVAAQLVALAAAPGGLGGALGTVELVDADAEEEEELVDEAEALRLWRAEGLADRTAHLAPVPGPDGRLVMPTHAAVAAAAASEPSASTAGDGWVSATRAHLQRDPALLTLDNVRRVDVSELRSVSWTEPVMITGVAAGPGLLDGGALTLPQLVARFGDAEVRTGNRNTFVESGISNSLPMALREAMAENVTVGGDRECSRMVFSPVQELPPPFQQHLEPLTAAFPCEHEAQGRARIQKKFTLCLANEGFGIGFHNHAAAMFLLVVGRKKWYMGPPATEQNTPTHPGFYCEKSSHKCIQAAGELLYVPDLWFHEIFNLERYTAGIQALPE